MTKRTPAGEPIPLYDFKAKVCRSIKHGGKPQKLVHYHVPEEYEGETDKFDIIYSAWHCPICTPVESLGFVPYGKMDRPMPMLVVEEEEFVPIPKVKPKQRFKVKRRSIDWKTIV